MYRSHQFAKRAVDGSDFSILRANLEASLDVVVHVVRTARNVTTKNYDFDISTKAPNGSRTRLRQIPGLRYHNRRGPASP